MTENYREIIKQAALDEQTFVQLTLKGKIGAGMPWRLVTVRPVTIKNRRHLQVSHFDAKQDTTKNYVDAEAEAKLDDLLALPFYSLHLRATTEEISVQITQKGKAIIHRNRPEHAQPPDLKHDSSKPQPIPRDDPFLMEIGLTTNDGRIRADMRDKYAQVNEFLKMLESTGVLNDFEHSPVHILDCGCGSAHLSLSAHHYMSKIRGIPATLSGVDMNSGLMERNNIRAERLNLREVCFYPGTIIQHQPQTPPDILLALHACDTATDEALALGIQHNAPLILAVPCCHHSLHEQLVAREPFNPVMRHGILKERLADILTDSFRALILRIIGYKTDVIEFISSEHTGRNLMIRAIKRTAPGEAEFIEEYNALKAFWGVTPHLETLLKERGMMPDHAPVE